MGQPLFLRKSYPLWQKRLRSACACAKLLSKEKKDAGLAAEELPMKIYTLTLSPAYDVHAVSGKITACHENLATVQSREAGGKGVNISRALHNYGVENKAVVLLGSQNSGDFKQALRECGLDCILFEQEGRIRENLTIHCPGDPETRISFTGFQAEAQILEKIHAAMDVDKDTVVTFTGRVPEGIAMEKVKSFLKELKARGAKIVLDSRSFGAEDIFEVKPWLIKPNQEEISMFFHCPVDTVEAALEKGRIFAEKGVENTMVSLGGAGALLIAGEECFVAEPPRVNVLSTIGAGDSSIAGFIAAAMAGKDRKCCLRTAVAFGTAACLTAGSMPPKKEDIDKILDQVTVTQI